MNTSALFGVWLRCEDYLEGPCARVLASHASLSPKGAMARVRARADQVLKIYLSQSDAQGLADALIAVSPELVEARVTSPPDVSPWNNQSQM